MRGISFKLLTERVFLIWPETEICAHLRVNFGQTVRRVRLRESMRSGYQTVARVYSFKVVCFFYNIRIGRVAICLCVDSSDSASAAVALRGYFKRTVLTVFNCSTLLLNGFALYFFNGPPSQIGTDIHRGSCYKFIHFQTERTEQVPYPLKLVSKRGAFDSAKNHKRQRRKRQSVTAKREKSQTPKFVKVRLG